MYMQDRLFLMTVINWFGSTCLWCVFPYLLCLFLPPFSLHLLDSDGTEKQNGTDVERTEISVMLLRVFLHMFVLKHIYIQVL